MILKVKRREHGFAIMTRSALEDHNLSFKARGIYAYLMTKPESWTINMKDLQRGKDGREAVQTGLKELQAVGLAEYKSSQATVVSGSFTRCPPVNGFPGRRKNR